jgi:hypothetical protein
MYSILQPPTLFQKTIKKFHQNNKKIKKKKKKKKKKIEYEGIFLVIDRMNYTVLYIVFYMMLHKEKSLH